MSSHHESSLLRPRDPSLLNSDYWPEFELKNAYIFDPDSPSAAASLLHAGAYRPLTITGKLDPPNKSNLGAWLDSATHRTCSVEITAVKEFSYGQYADGTLDIWAAGQAGWFTIRPSRAYRDTYNDMVQAVKLLYFVADSYKALKRHADLPARALFQKCCDESIDACRSIQDAQSLFAKHRHFLIASMLTGKEALQWFRVPLYSWLQETYPDDFELIRQRINHKPPKASSRKGSTQSPAPSTASSRRKKATAKQRSSTPRSILSQRTTRSTRSTRSQSIATVDSSSIVVADVSHQENFPEPVSTPNNVRSRVESASPSSSDNDLDDTGYGRRGKGKSALRPRPSKYIPARANDPYKDSPANHGRNTVPPQPEMIETDDMSVDGSEHDSQEPSNPQVEDVDDEANQAAKFETSIPIRLQDAEKNGNVWHCPVDGCMHKVYAMSEPGSQLLIKAHEQTHDFDHDERIRLVRRMEAPWLPVNRLMDRVRGMASQNKFPPPVVQRY